MDPASSDSEDISLDSKKVGASFDTLHPPSPKVSKGGPVKGRKPTLLSTPQMVNEDSEESSDIDIRLSGKVASTKYSSDTESMITSEDQLWSGKFLI